MKALRFAFFLFLVASGAFAQTQATKPQMATTESGRKVILNGNGTWEYQAAESPTSTVRSETISLGAMISTRQTLDALLKASDAVRLGANMVEFRTLLLDAKGKVNDSLAMLPDGSELKNEIVSAVEDYELYIGIFNSVGKADIDAGSKTGKILIEKYGMKPEKSLFSKYLPGDWVFATLMNSSTAHHNKARAALNKIVTAYNETHE